MSLPRRIVLTAAIALIASITFVAATTRIRPSTARSAHWAGTAAELREVVHDFASFCKLASRDRDFFAGWWRGLRADSAEIAVVEIDKDGGVHISGNAGFSSGVLATLSLPNGRDEPRVAFNYRAAGALSSPAAKHNQMHQSGGAFVPADTAGMGVWGGVPLGPLRTPSAPAAVVNLNFQWASFPPLPLHYIVLPTLQIYDQSSNPRRNLITRPSLMLTPLLPLLQQQRRASDGDTSDAAAYSTALCIPHWDSAHWVSSSLSLSRSSCPCRREAQCQDRTVDSGSKGAGGVTALWVRCRRAWYR
ncbi:hypothetical protein C8J57DRAFT_1728063 [Mycena rebaudengoi]|nr:hypothetical protein C8J57DRAFT_1728063 [Mycena rebaudengoi]